MQNWLFHVVVLRRTRERNLQRIIRTCRTIALLLIKPFLFSDVPVAVVVFLRPWKTRTHCCGHIVAHGVSWAAQTGKHLLRTQNVSEHNQKHFCVSDSAHKCCPRWQMGKHLCRQQCVCNNVSSFQLRPVL